MNIFRILIPLLVIGIISLAPLGFANANSLITAEFSLEQGEFTVGDPLPIKLTVNHPMGYKVILPQIESSWGDFLVHSQSAGTTVANQDGTETTTQLIDARLFSPGTFETSPLNITISDSSGQLSEVTVAPISVNIASVLVEGDAELRDIKPQAAIPYVNYFSWIIGLGILTFIVVTGYLLLYRRRKQHAIAAEDNRLPHEVAIDELNRVESLDLPEAGRFKEHYTLVSDCIRIYIEKSFEFPVLERTTGEIRSNLKRTELSSTLANQFLDLLVESDLVKFSKFTPDVHSARQVLINGREIVELTMSTRIDHEVDENQVSPPPPNPKFGKNGSNQKAEVTL